MTELPDVLIAYGAACFRDPSLPMPAPASVILVCAVEPYCSARMEHIAEQCRAPARAAPQIDRESSRARAMSFEKLARLWFVELRQPAQALAGAIVVAERVVVSAGHTVSLVEAARRYSPGVTPTIRLKCRHR
jgi:hypothetical protein